MFKFILLLALFALNANSAPTQEGDIENEIRFENSNGEWITIPLVPIDVDDDDDDSEPRFSAEKHVIPSLFTNESPEISFDLTPSNSKGAPVNPDLPVKVIIHGWIENGGKSWVLTMKDEYLKNGKYNVIAVDWSTHAHLEYSISAKKTKKVGNYLGEVLVSLMENHEIDPKDIHIAGHSLGAHAAGFAAKKILELTGKKIGRISGLDPAGPLFEVPFLVKKTKRLDIDDADFVDIIHTCGGLLALGFKNSLGDVDFYPNGGSDQRGCVLTQQICDHARSYIYFTESINSDKFVATACPSWKKYKKGKCAGNEEQIMGLSASTDARGDYYLKTNKKSPFAMG